MIVSCPACQTRFNVDASALSDLGRKVRCSNCGKIWHQMPFDESNSLSINMGDGENVLGSYDQPQKTGEEKFADNFGIEEPQEPGINMTVQTISQWETDASLIEKAMDEGRVEKAGSGWAGSLLLILVLLGLFGGGYLYHIEIVEFWPSTGLFFELLGLGPDKR